MIEWNTAKNPEKDGQYLVYCVAPNFDAEWIDIARFDKDKWHHFRSEVSHALRVRAWAEINTPDLSQL